MIEIKNFKFTENIDTKNNMRVNNWPVIYLIEDGKKMYVGETNNFVRRMKQHYKTPEKRNLKRVHMITDNDFNKSAIRDIESALIGYIDADSKYKLLNNNHGFVNQEYYDRKLYKEKIPDIWNKLIKKGLAEKEIFQIENSDLFKYSPFKTLSDDQFAIAQMILSDTHNKEKSMSFIEGNPGTGKTILAMYLLKILANSKHKQGKNVALVVPMTSLRKTLKYVCSKANGLSSSLIIGPTEVNNKKYDTLIVDETHRLSRYKAIANRGSFKQMNIKMGFEVEDGNQLDWILASAKHHIFFYDEGQSVRPSDIEQEVFEQLKHKYNHDNTIYQLFTQHRTKGGNEYIQFVDHLLSNQKLECIPPFDDYKLELIDDFETFNKLYKTVLLEDSLTRMVSGYSFEWLSKNDKSKYDIIIDGIKWQWNSKNINWIHSENSVNEVGCIHSVQGYDLGHIFLIFGYEIDYDFDKKAIIVDKDKYHDKNGKNSTNESDLKDYILNIYNTLMTRGINGIYMYACNKGFYKYLKTIIDKGDIDGRN